MTEQAEEVGYYLLETGLRLRAPGLQSTDEHIFSSTTRSAENALIQGFGMLTVTALNRFQQAIEDDGMDNDVVIIMSIHDANYGYCTNTPEVISWVNEHLIMEMTKDFYPDQDIKLKAELEIGRCWAEHTTIPNNATIEVIQEVLDTWKDQ